MKISQATAKPKPLEVTFGEAKLNVQYKPLTYTVREMDELQDSKDVKQIVSTMKRLVVSWDLTDDDEQPVALDYMLNEDESVNVADPLLDIPSHIFTGILKAVAEDQKPSGEAGKPSDAS